VAKAALGIAPGQLARVSGTPTVDISAGHGLGLGPALVMLADSWPMIGMLAAHLAAAALLAWWLRRGERAAWGAARRLARAVTARFALRPRLAAASRPRTRPTIRRRDRRRDLLWAAATCKRGPPAPA
jgi:hypothetical protein